MSARLSPNSFSLAEIRRAEEVAKQVTHALSTPSEIDHSLRTLLVLANTLQKALEHFTVDWIDKPFDELQALRNLSTNLVASACEARDQITIALGIVVDYRLETGHNEKQNSADLQILAEEITGALQSMVEDVVHEKPAVHPQRSRLNELEAAVDMLDSLKREATQAAAQAASEPVIANRRTGIYHPANSPVIERIAEINRIAFVSTEAAELDGFRASRASNAAAEDC